MGWELHMERKGMTGGHGKEQQEVFSKADNRSEVTEHGHLPAGYVHTLAALLGRCTELPGCT